MIVQHSGAEEERYVMDKSFNIYDNKSAFDFGLLCAMGKIRGAFGTTKFFNTTAGATEHDVWEPGGADIVYMDTATQLTISSDSALDTDQGAGAWSVGLIGLDANYDICYDTVLMNGTTPVQTTSAFIRVWRVAVRNGGDPCTPNAGNISVMHGANMQAYIRETAGQTLMSHFTTPRNYCAFITSATLSAGVGKPVHVHVKARTFLQDDVFQPNAVFQVKRAFSLDGTTLHAASDVPRILPPGTDYKWTILASKLSASFSGDYGLILMDMGMVNIEEAVPLKYQVIN